jgi:hypothetical protein
MTNPLHPEIDKYRRRKLGAQTNSDRERSRSEDLRYRSWLNDDPSYWNQLLADGIQLPPGFQKGAGTEVFTPVSSTGYVRYLGRAMPRLQSVEFLFRVTTLGAVPTYCEFGLMSASEDPTIATGLADNWFTTLGWVDAAAQVTSTGRKKLVIYQFDEINAGMHLWIAFVHQSATGLVMRGGLPQECGLMLSKAGSARPSTLAAESQFTEVATTFQDLWLPFRQIQS